MNYFWGGKSLVLGWDFRWGTPKEVWAAGSPSTGTVRPYGLDCSGFVDWVFYNISGGSYIIGQTGFVSSDVSHPKEEERNVVTRIVGEGELDWPGILRAVKAQGYEGWLSLEYERRWHPDDIPDASIGMKQSAEYLRRIFPGL